MAAEAIIEPPTGPRLTVVPNQQAERMAALVWLREKGRQGVALPKRLYNWCVDKLSDTGFAPVNWIRRVIAAARDYIRRAMGLLGRGGAALGALWLATSENGQKALSWVFDTSVKVVRWTIDTAVTAVATPISWLGKPGRWLASKIVAAKNWVYDKLVQLWGAGQKVRDQLRHDKPAVKVANGIARFAGVMGAVLRFTVAGPLRGLALLAALPFALRPEARDKIKGLGKDLKQQVAPGKPEDLPTEGPTVLSRIEATNLAVTNVLAWLAPADVKYPNEEAARQSLAARMTPVLQQIVSRKKAELAAKRLAEKVVPFDATGSLDEQRILLTQLMTEVLDSVINGQQPANPGNPRNVAAKSGSAKAAGAPAPSPTAVAVMEAATTVETADEAEAEAVVEAAEVAAEAATEAAETPAKTAARDQSMAAHPAGKRRNR